MHIYFLIYVCFGCCQVSREQVRLVNDTTHVYIHHLMIVGFSIFLLFSFFLYTTRTERCVAALCGRLPLLHAQILPNTENHFQRFRGVNVHGVRRRAVALVTGVIFLVIVFFLVFIFAALSPPFTTASAAVGDAAGKRSVQKVTSGNTDGKERQVNTRLLAKDHFLDHVYCTHDRI